MRQRNDQREQQPQRQNERRRVGYSEDIPQEPDDLRRNAEEEDHRARGKPQERVFFTQFASAYQLDGG
jgi:hypothetical protein